MQTLSGLGVSGGIAIGQAVCVRSRIGEVIRFPLLPEDVEAEIARFDEAVRRTQQDLERIRSKVATNLGTDLSGIFDAHLLLARDPGLLDSVKERIRRDLVNAEWAVSAIVKELQERFAAIEDLYLQEREQDLVDVSRQLIRSLEGVSHHELSEIEGDVVIVADDLTPSDAVRLGREQVVGFAIETGGRTSHTTIIARSLNLPAVARLHEMTDRVTDADPVILDGEAGCLILHPTPETLEEYWRRQAELARLDRERMATRALKAITQDGVEVQLMANIDLEDEIPDIKRYGAHGVGLYRSEFLYIEKSPEMPSEEDHLAIYRSLAEASAPYPAVIRTYDLGGRKMAREVMATHEDNPVLGLRGVRLTLARPHIFRTQLRALFRAALYGDLRIMIPLVSTVEEVRQFRAFCEEVFRELESEGLPFRRDVKLGVMIEVPSAAITADLIAREVDFFSIGTNDLIQYSLAVDRNNDHVAELYMPLHPAILRMLRFVVDSALKAGIEVSVCGEMAADPHFAALLVGMGLRRLSISPRVVPEIKTQIREISVNQLEQVVGECLELGTADEIERRLGEALATAFSH